MAMEQKLIYNCVCQDCGYSFLSTSRFSSYCKQCQKRRRHTKRSEKVNMKIYNAIDELMLYNRKHGTNLSYGQYFGVKEMKKWSGKK